MRKHWADLDHHGEAMTPEPTNISLDDLVNRLRLKASVVVNLEPGDATKYTLALNPLDLDDRKLLHYHPLQQIIFVTRVMNGDPGPTIAISSHNPPHLWGVKKLSNNNEWTEGLLQWWLSGLMTAVIYD